MALQSEDFIARRTESIDAERIAHLVTRHTETVFGRIDVENVIEHANLSITLVGVESGDVLGHVALYDYPSDSSVDQAKWEPWMQDNYQCGKTTPLNTLFIHLFVAKEGFLQAAYAELLRATFMAVPLLQYVYLTTPTGTNLGSALLMRMSMVMCNSEECSTDVYVAERTEHYPMLHIRPARVEDADDLMPIFTQYSSEVSEEYGEFFLAELIASQDKHHKTIVADVGGRAIGFLSVTTKVDTDLLNSCYQLEPFHGLRRPVEEDEIKSVSTIGTVVDSTITAFTSSSQTEAQPSRTPSTSAGSFTGGAPISPTPTNSQPFNITTHHSQNGKLVSQHSIASRTSGVFSLHDIIAAERKEGEESNSSASSSSHSGSGSGSGGGLEGSTRPSDVAMRSSPTAAAGGGEVQQDQQQEQQESQKKSSMLELMGSSVTSKAHLHSGSKVVQIQDAASGDDQDQSRWSRHSMGPRGSPSLDTAPSTTEPKTELPKRPRKKQYLLKGECNALAVQLFAIEDKFETRSLDLLPEVFKLFPEYDFLVLSQPHSYPEFPLLSHFSRVPPRVGASISQELYVLHKCGLLHSFSVSEVCSSDLPEVAKLSAELHGCSELNEDVKRYVEGKRDPLVEGGTPISAIVAKCANQVVGVAVLRNEKNMRYIRSHYNIEDFVYYDYHEPSQHASLHHFMLNPVFASYAKHFLKECLRLSHKSCLYYPLYPGTVIPAQDGRPHSIITALAHMVPIKPRRQIVYSMPHLTVNAPLPEVLEDKPHYALYHTNRKLTLEPKITVNARVVVVGASDTALSFLESLVFSPHLYFTNLTLVSPHTTFLTTPTTYKDHDPSPTSDSSDQLLKWPALPSSLCYMPHQFSQLGLGTWINMTRQKMVTINRSEQCVTVESGGNPSLVYYDYLVLCTGMQFQVPSLRGHPSPRNVFALNDDHEIMSFLNWAGANFKVDEAAGDLVIYGNNLEVYSIINVLLDCGFPPNKLLHARPNSPTPSSHNQVVQECLNVGVKDTGVKTWTDLTLKGWEVDEQGKLIGVRLSPNEDRVRSGMRREEGVGGGDSEEGEWGMEEGEDMDYVVPCQALIYMDQKHVDTQAFKAMNDACLVFDKRLVISTDHATNDPLIFAAGPVTKFSRRYRADQWNHSCYNSYEVGQRLGLTVLSRLDPTADDPSHTLDPDLLPTYTQYKAIAANLPGGYHYLHVFTPRPLATIANKKSQNFPKEHELSTNTENGYMYLHLNNYGLVDEIVALSPTPLKEMDNYLCLYNVHERYLNNMLQRYKDKLIPDFYDFFRQSWACAIFHDRFGDLLEEIREHLEVQPVENEKSLIQCVQKLLQDDPNLTLTKYRDHLKQLFDASTIKNFVDKKLFKYLQYNAHHLPMYAKPNMI